jgi:hypothetical protein
MMCKADAEAEGATGARTLSYVGELLGDERRSLAPREIRIELLGCELLCDPP